MEAKCFGYVLLGKIHGANSGHVGENSSLDLSGKAFAPSCKEEVIGERDNQQKIDGLNNYVS